MIYTKKIIVACFYLLIAISCLGQSSILDFKIYGFEDGLSHRNVFGITQDSTGFIWVATINGLNRFDGEKFNSYSSTSGDIRLPQNYLTSIEFEVPEKIWISHRGGLSNIDFSVDSLSHFKLKKNTPLSKQDWDAEEVTSTKNGTVAIGTNAKTGQSFILKIENDSLSPIYNLNNKAGKTAIASWNDGIIFEYQAGQLRHIDLNGKVKSDYKLPENNAETVVNFFKQDNTLLAITIEGAIYKFEQNGFVKINQIDSPFLQREIETLYAKANGELWVGGYAELWHYDAKAKIWTNHHEEIYRLSKNTCTFRDIYEDKMGILWVASDFGLVKVAQQQRIFSNYLSEGNEHCNNGFCSTRGITHDENGNVFFSMYNTIQVLDAKTDEVRPLFGKKEFYNPPFGLLYEDGFLWTGNGLRINLTSGKIDKVLANENEAEGVVAVDIEKKVWLGIGNQIFHFEKSLNKYVEFKDPKGLFDEENKITYLLPSKVTPNILWVATNDKGIYKINSIEGTSKHITADSTSSPRLPSNRIIGMQEDKKGNLWIASAKGVVNMDATAESANVFSTKDGLPNDFINGILIEGDSAVWISTDNGLSRLSFGKQSFLSKNLKVSTRRFFNFFQQDGISANEFNRISFHKTPDGRMYFGGLNGINAFYPNAEMYKSPEHPTVQLVLTEFSKYNPGVDSVERTIVPEKALEGVTMEAQDRFFEFDFALLDFNQPEKNRYSYLLEGYTKDWSPPFSENFVRFNDVPPGDYTFKLRGSATGSKWNKQSIEIPVTIKKPFYRTLWFYILSTLLLAGLIIGFIRWREYNSRLRQIKLEKEVQTRTRELKAEKKKSDDLLLNILPEETANELKKFGEAKAKRHEMATVLFSDFKNFSQIAETMEPEVLVSEIDLCFRAFDQIMEKYGLEKIKTIGDAYMCAGGLTTGHSQEATCNVVRAGLEMQEFLTNLQKTHPTAFQARIGIHSGPVVAGVVGLKKFAYDIWGDTVNLASRMETYSDVGKVNLSDSTYEIVKHHFNCKQQATFTTKTDAEIKMYFVEGEKE